MLTLCVDVCRCYVVCAFALTFVHFIVLNEDKVKILIELEHVIHIFVYIYFICMNHAIVTKGLKINRLN